MQLYRYTYKLYYNNYDVEISKESYIAHDKDFMASVLNQPWQGGYLDDITVLYFKRTYSNLKDKEKIIQTLSNYIK